MKQFRWIAVALAIVGCGNEADPESSSTPPVPPRIRLHVAAASDLQRALPALVQRYRTDHPDVEVVTTLGSSGQLAEQVRGGAPFAVFLSANEAYVSALASEGLLKSGSTRPYASGTLVIATRREMKTTLANLNDLTRPEYRRIVIANPETAPYGAAARQALQKAELWSRLRLSLVFAESVRQALQFVETGNADAGLVSEALIQGDRLRTVAIDSVYYDPIVQWLGVVAKLPEDQLKEAERFASFVVSEQGATILKSFGLQSPEPAPDFSRPAEAASAP
ncbi:MAG: molybdate ABC transporter substrate-binding protein [Isosphaeraceae bacterium]